MRKGVPSYFDDGRLTNSSDWPVGALFVATLCQKDVAVRCACWRRNSSLHLRSMVERSKSETQPQAEAEHEAQLNLLRLLERHPEYSQRQMAMAMGVSVGKTHYVLKALLKKGWVKALNFQRSPSKLVYLYRLTPNGLSHRMQLTQSFLARKEGEYVALRGEISSLRRELEGHPTAESPLRDSK